MHTDFIDYQDGSETCEGYVAYDGASEKKRPCVLVSHAWGGQSKFEQDKARKLAELGYVGFALDNYGKGKRGSNFEENGKLMQPFLDDRNKLKARLLAGLEAAKKHPMVDPDKIAIIGFCFGGLCTLDMARAVPDGLKGAVSFHGLFYPPAIGEQKDIKAKILILHGYDDPMATPKQMVEVADEMTAAKADWQLVAYGNTSHAFTNPEMNMPENGLQYKEAADRRSWQAMQNFLTEVFA